MPHAEPCFKYKTNGRLCKAHLPFVAIGMSLENHFVSCSSSRPKNTPGAKGIDDRNKCARDLYLRLSSLCDPAGKFPAVD